MSIPFEAIHATAVVRASLMTVGENGIAGMFTFPSSLAVLPLAI